MNDNIISRARESISSFCINECKSYCCRKGYLSLQEKEVKLVINDSKVSSENLVKQPGGSFSFNLGWSEIGCPSLDLYKCKIHSDPNRPKVCRDYPLFLIGNVVNLSSRCLAVRNNLLYPFVKEFMQSGFRVVESVDFQDSDIYPPLSLNPKDVS